ncbi:hypothetical protein [Dyella tabacisoli]|uniref:Uncharacterized protein n=1 Tax=Dyella tabacisoli TaxID=2282381 RepID=A0A369UK99_9GAMM|nr:hypothetical protein [Dyella tabacisoli]RDD80976.1 hypothetical protein DVJ77_14855 [Dyella tabacisoli]
MTTHRGGFGVGPNHAVQLATAHTSASLNRPDGTAGGAASAPAHDTVAKVRRTKFDAAPWCPPWVQKMATEKATIEEVVHTAVKRAQRHTTEETLVEIETLLNELSRDPEHARQVRDALSKDVIADLLMKGAKP